MSYKSLGLLVVVLLCGVICSFLVKSVLVDTVPAMSVMSQDETTQVIVALTDLPIGTEISPKKIKFAQYPKDKVSREAITGFAEIDKRRIIRPVRANTPISLYDLELEPEAAPEQQLTFLPPGYTVVPIRIESISSSGGISELIPFVRPEELLVSGDKVTVSLVYEESLNSPWDRISKDEQAHRLTTKTLLEDVEVYDSSLQRATTQEQGRDKVAVVSLLLNQENAAMVKSVVKSGKLRLVPGDRKIDESGFAVANKIDQESTPTDFLLSNSFVNPDKTTVEPTLVAQTSANELLVIPETSVSIGAGNATFLSNKPSGTNGPLAKNDPEIAIPINPIPAVRPTSSPGSLPVGTISDDSGTSGNDTFLNQGKSEGVSPDSQPKSPASRPLPSTVPRSPVDYTTVNHQEFKDSAKFQPGGMTAPFSTQITPSRIIP